MNIDRGVSRFLVPRLGCMAGDLITDTVPRLGIILAILPIRSLIMKVKSMSQVSAIVSLSKVHRPLLAHLSRRLIYR